MILIYYYTFLILIAKENKRTMHTYEKLPLKPRDIIWKFCKFSFGTMILFAVIKGLVEPITARLTEELIDNVTEVYTSGRFEWSVIVLPVVMLSLCVLFKLGKDVIEELIEIQVTNNLRRNCNYAYAEKLSRLKYEIFDDKQRWTRGYKRYKETSGLIEWKECQIFHSIFT